MQPLNALVHNWPARSGLRARAVSWSWFSQAFEAALEAQRSMATVDCTSDQPALSKAFFAWAEAVDAQAAYEALDELDFRHFICGLLLQKLLSSPAPVLACGEAGAGGVAITRFVLTLLQALRLDAGARPFELDPACTEAAWISSFLENVHEDSSSAISFLDQMTGLVPVWRGPSLIESRPAMKKALSRS